MPDAVVALAIGAVLVAIGITIVSTRKRDAGGEEAGPSAPAWAQAFGVDAPLDKAARVDIVERLALLGEPWCFDALRDALSEERDAAVAQAIRNALQPRSSEPSAPRRSYSSFAL